MSSASERANEQVSGPVLTTRFLGVLNHNAGLFRNCVYAVLQKAEDPIRYWAESIYWGQDDMPVLIRGIIPHSETDLVEIKARFVEMYGEEMADVVTKNIDYKPLRTVMLIFVNGYDTMTF